MSSETRFAHLGECLSLVIDHRGKTPRKLGSDWVDQGVPTISAKNVSGGKLVSQGAIRYITQDVYRRWMSSGGVERGDCLLVSEGATLGECMYWDQDYPVALGQRLFCLRANPDVLYSRYLYFYMTTHAFQSEVMGRATGTSVFGLRQTDLLKLGIRLPPLEEQRLVGDSLFHLNKKMELNRRMSETLETMVRVLFKSWFVDFDPVRAKMEGRDPGLPQALGDLFPSRLVDSELGELPDGWPVEALGDHYDAVKGVSYKGSGLGNEGTPLHNLNSIYEGGGYKYEGIKYYSGEYAERHIVRPGDVIVANTEQGHDRLLIGYAAIVPSLFGSSGIASHHLYRMRPKPNSSLTPAYLCSLLNSVEMHDLVSGYANGTTVNMLPIDGVQRTLILRPPAALVSAFDSVAMNSERRREKMISESRTLTGLRDTLLPRLISGELRLKDAARIIESIAA